MIQDVRYDSFAKAIVRKEEQENRLHLEPAFVGMSILLRLSAYLSQERKNFFRGAVLYTCFNISSTEEK